MVFFADIIRISDLPAFEIEEIKMVDKLPTGLNFGDLYYIFHLKWVQYQAKNTNRIRMRTQKDIVEVLPMKTGKKLKKKVFGYIVQQSEDGEWSLLVYLCVPGVPFRLVGGNVDPGEELMDALHREIAEESGLNDLTFIKKLGTQRYYKAFIDANVERHDYLLLSNKRLPRSWEHVCSSDGEDNGEVFKYQWITIDELDRVHEEFRLHIQVEYRDDIFCS